jgi:hypothetical protein
VPPRRTTNDRVRRPVLAALPIVLVVVSLVLAFAMEPALAGRKRTYRLRKGVTLTNISRRGPVKIHVITVTNPDERSATIDVGSAGRSFPAWKRPSDIARSYRAIAAVNGDFARDGRPIHPSAEDGDLRSSGLATGVAFAMSANERRGFANRPNPRVEADTSNPQAGSFKIDRWNAGGTGSGRIVGYTRVGGSVERPEKDNCTARLLPADGSAGRRQWGRDGTVKRTYVVERQPEPCPNEAAAVGDDLGAVLLAAKRDGGQADTIRALKIGDKVTISWGVGWGGVLDVIGGAPQLLADRDGNGNPTVTAPKDCGSYFCSRNPRTGLGVNNACVTGRDGCKVFMMTVDGRQSGYSIGMDLVQLARQFERVGADWAINLDGGGGAAMWVANRGRYCQKATAGGCLVSRPSDPNGERPAVGSLMVLPDSDRGEPLDARRLAEASTLLPGTTTAENIANTNAALTDPGSTGGLLDAIFSGGLGRAPSRSSVLWHDAQVYRASRR